VLVRQTAVGDRLRIAARGGARVPRSGPHRRLLRPSPTHRRGPVHALIEAAIAAGDLRPTTVLLVAEQGPHYLAKAFAALAEAHGG